MKCFWFFVFLFVCGLVCVVDVSGVELYLLWGVLFVGILFLIVIVLFVVFKLWYDYYGKIVVVWVLVFLVLFGIVFGFDVVIVFVNYVVLVEYIFFIVLIVVLYVVVGGICICGNLYGMLKFNMGLIVFGMVLVSIMGIIGVVMFLIWFLLCVNEVCWYCVYVVVFFIFLVVNVGGVFMLLGDLFLFLGFL